MKRPIKGVERPASGFSLIEVILATAMLLGSVVVLGELAGIGRRQSVRGRVLADAQQLCERTLNEVITGLRPLEPVEQEPLLPVAPVPGEPDMDTFGPGLSDSSDPFAFDDESSGVAPEAMEDDPESAEWLHSLRVTPLELQPGLAVLTVVVEQAPEVSDRPVRFELSRWIDDPNTTETEGTTVGRPISVAGQGRLNP